MSKILSFFTYGSGGESEQPPQPRKEAIRALPTPWYTTPEMYQLERRAIFSKRWMFITHKSRLQQPGDFLRYSVANFDFILIVDRQNKINAFHNVCRHRAYQVVEEDEGRKNILSCKYHGWSYGLNGKLAKAPAYDQLDRFNKEQNSLLPIHTHVDKKGFVWINMDSKAVPENSWQDQFREVDEQKRFSKFNFDDYQLDHSYSMEGEYNWKILSDNFNECYHCKTTHPDVPNFLTIDSHDCVGKDGHIQHDQAPSPEQVAKGFDVNSTYYFPNSSMSVSPHFMMIQKFLPTSPTTCSMHYEVYRNKNSSDADFHEIADTYGRVMKEDKALCEKAQRNLNAGVFVAGELHPRWEKGPLYFQQQVRDVVTEHYQKEKKVGGQIWPARQQAPAEVESDLEICNGLGCDSRKEILAW